MDLNVDSFLQYLQKERKYSLNTVQAYENDLLEFSEFCEKRLSKDVLNVGVSDVREWIVEMSDGSGAVGVRTVKRRISALRSFYKYLRREGLVSKNPAAVLVLPKASKPLPKFFREEEMGRLLDDVMTGDEFQDRRDKLIIDLFYQTGVRVSELVEIKDSDIDIIVSLDKSRPVGLKFFGMWTDLKEILGRKVDLVSEGTLLPFAKESVEKDKILIYERTK